MSANHKNSGLYIQSRNIEIKETLHNKGDMDLIIKDKLRTITKV